MGLLLSVIDELEESLQELVTDTTFKALHKRPISIQSTNELPCLELRLAGNPYQGRGTGRDQWNVQVHMLVIIYAQQTGSDSHVRTLASFIETVRSKIRTHFSVPGSGINLDAMDGSPDPEVTALSADHLMGYIDVVCSGLDTFSSS